MMKPKQKRRIPGDKDLNDVESVINLLMVGADGKPRYKVSAPMQK